MTGNLVLVAFPNLLAGGDFKGYLQSVTFTATNGSDLHQWSTTNIVRVEVGLKSVLHPDIAAGCMERLRAGETVTFPGRWELNEIMHNFDAPATPLHNSVEWS